MILTLLGTGDAFGSGGRYSTCLHLTSGAKSSEVATGSHEDFATRTIASGETILIDCGATSMHALQKAGIDRAAISSILVTHFHGDHFGGLPFMLLDAMFVTKRQTPLLIAGPKGVEERMRIVCEALFPGFIDFPRSFELRFLEVTPEQPGVVSGFDVTAFPVVHDERAGPCQAYRIRRGDKTFAFSGDTTWTEALLDVARGADLFLTECYKYATKMHNHMDWKTLEQRLPELTAKRIVITHMSGEMLEHDGPLPVTRAQDGMVITI